MNNGPLLAGLHVQTRASVSQTNPASGAVIVGPVLAMADSIRPTDEVRIAPMSPAPTLADIEAALAAEESVQRAVIVLLATVTSEVTAALVRGPAAVKGVVTFLDSHGPALAAAVAAKQPATSSAHGRT
jgi:hypothetical protein